MSNRHQHQPPHFHIHYGDADELEVDESLYTTLPPVYGLEATVTEVIAYLTLQKSVVASDSVTDFGAYHVLDEALYILANMTDDHMDIIEQVGLELELEKALSISIIPCEDASCKG
jgi:hypothetical protein